MQNVGGGLPEVSDLAEEYSDKDQVEI